MTVQDVPGVPVAQLRDPHPVVTIVVPMLNEQGSIQACLDGFAKQTYGTSHLDVVVVDGGSTDGSREWVEEYSVEHPWVRIVENPKKKASAAFNAGLAAAEGDVLVLFSSHGEPMVDFVEQAVAVLLDSGAAGVGGRYLHIGTSPTSMALGLAMVSPFGMASPHRTVTERVEVDTISHPAYVTDAMRDTGWFDEGLERNSDYEYNHRMRERGHRLIVDPAIGSIYHPRGSLRALGRQFWWYGRWKERVVRRHPGSLKVRHLVPPSAVVAAAVAPIACAWPAGRRVVGLGVVGYAALVALAVRRAEPRDHGADALTLAACFPIMHGAWGAGFVASVLEDSWKAARAT